MSSKKFDDVKIGDILISRQRTSDGSNFVGIVEAINYSPTKNLTLRFFRNNTTYVIHSTSIGVSWDIVT
jgi:hypothetical protein